MLLKFDKEPETYVNLDQDFLSEIYQMSSDSKEGLFKIGESYLDFNKIILEIQRTDYKTIKEIYLSFPAINKEQISEISKFYHFNEEQNKEVEKVESVTAVFSVDKEVIEKYIQPNYEKPESSTEIFNCLDEEENAVLLDFQYLNLESFR